MISLKEKEEKVDLICEEIYPKPLSRLTSEWDQGPELWRL
jgi:hypothetical protein